MHSVSHDPVGEPTAKRPCCLIVSDDPAVIKPFEGVPSELEIACEFTSEVGTARKLLSARRFDAVVADCDMDGAFEIFKQLRASSPNRGSVLISVVSGSEAGFQAFKAGANLLLEKPVSADWTKRTLRAAHGTLWAQYRRYFRFRTNLPVCVTLPSAKQIHGAVRNISQGGLMLVTEPGIRTFKPLRLKINLPGTDRVVEACATPVWSDAQGQTGMRFLRLTEEDWLLIEQRLGIKSQDEDV